MCVFIVVVLLVVSSLGGGSVWVQIVEVVNVKYEQVFDFVGQKLVFNGVGICYKFVIKVYMVGFYLIVLVYIMQEVLVVYGFKCIYIQMLCDIDGNELGKFFIKGMEVNVLCDEFVKFINGVFKFSEVFVSCKQFNSGDNFLVDYVFGIGLILLVNGKLLLSEFIKEFEFFSVLLCIWLGDKLVDDNFKEFLLGVKCECWC